jgi:S1-C subfamily serine protease
MRPLSDSNPDPGKFFFRAVCHSMFRFVVTPAVLLCAFAGLVKAQSPFQSLVIVTRSNGAPQKPQEPTTQISRGVKEVFDKSAKAVVKVRGTDEHSDVVGTGFFVDPIGTLYTAFSVAGETDSLTVDFDGKKLPARVLLADWRSGIALLKVDAVTPMLRVGNSSQTEVATPVVSIGFPLDLPKTPSFGMVAGFDRKIFGRYFPTTLLRVNVSTQRGEQGAPIVNFKGEVVGIIISGVVDSGSACYALPIDAAEKIRNDFARFGEARYGEIGIVVGFSEQYKEGSHTETTEIMKDTPAYESGVRPGDILLQVGKTRIREPEDVIDASFFTTAGDKIPITVMRGDEKLTFEIEAALHPVSRHTMFAAPPPQSSQLIPLRLDSLGRTP